MNQALFLLRLANFIVIFGSGITWTGLSFDLSIKYDDPRFMAFMQSLSVITSFMGPFIGLWINAHTTLRTIIIAAESVAATSCTAIFLILQAYGYSGSIELLLILIFVFFILLSGSVSGLFIEPLYAKLVEKRDGSDKNVRSEFATFAYFGILSKLLGMSIGPPLFAIISQYSLIINSCTFAISTILLWMAMNKITSNIPMIAMPAEEMTIFKKSTWKNLVGLPLIETAIANSMIFIVVLTMNTHAMSLEASPTELSFFWFGATACAFLSHFFLSRLRTFAEILFKIEKRGGFLQIIPVIGGLLTRDVTTLLIAQWIFSLLNPLSTNQSRSDFYQVYGRGKNRVLDAYAMRTTLTNIIVLVFSLTISLIGTKEVEIYLSIALSGLILLRWGIARRIFLKKQLERPYDLHNL